MSTSNAIPVLRTPDLRSAYQAARRILDLAIPMDRFNISAEAQARTLAEAQRMAAAFPDARLCTEDPYRPESHDDVRRMVVAGEEGVAAVLPVVLVIENQPVGSIEERFLDVIGSGPAYVDWDYFSWPAVPELGLDVRNKDAYVQIVFNCHGVGREVPASDHTVYIHFREGDVERAEWLARQAGLQPIGPVECGW